MNRYSRILNVPARLAALSLPCMAAAALAAPATVHDGALVDGKGMTLYTFDQDSGGKSMCNGACATNWPPLAALADATAEGDWTVIKRDDGSHQWSYKGKPLYTWHKDMKPGDMTGDGFRNAWHVARP
jgi:predicted lipoprotein with Yx(FWY)xxD motif